MRRDNGFYITVIGPDVDDPKVASDVSAEAQEAVQQVLKARGFDNYLVSSGAGLGAVTSPGS